MYEIISVILLLFIFFGGGGINYMPGVAKFLNTGLMQVYSYIDIHNNYLKILIIG
jgi:hypothetical protein